MLRRDYPDLPLIICSDAPDYLAEIKDHLDNNIIVSPLPSSQLTDFCIMYLAEGLIIANSTYSWWAAYLRNERKIIAPTPWWDANGFIGRSMGLDGPYLHYPEWYILSAKTGKIKSLPHENINLPLPEEETLDIYRVFRSIFV